MRHTDPYDAIAVGAQFYELNHGAQVRHRVESLLPHISPPRVGVLDVGAGSGTPTLAMARTWPGVPVHAVEPSRSMRIALLTRIAEEGDLQRQVTVHPVAAHELTRTGFVDLVTAFWALGMVEPDHWEATLNALVGALVPGGALLTESSLGEAEEDAAAVQDYRGSTRLGEHTIEHGGHVETAPDGSGHGVFTYRWLDADGHLLYEDHDHYEHRPGHARPDLAGSLEARGMVAERELDDPAAPGARLTLWRRPAV